MLVNMLRTLTRPTTRSAAVVAALLFLFSAAAAQARRAAQPSDDFVVAVMADDNRPALEGNSNVDLGRLSHAGTESQRHGGPQQTRSFSVTRHVRLRITRKNGASGVVRLSAFLVRDCYPCKLRLDGIELKTSPILVLQQAQLNSTTDHRLEIEIPASMPAGAVDAELGWEVEEK
jgi:hypothetical protein